MNRKTITIVELLISVLIGSMLVGGLIFFFNSTFRYYVHGRKNMTCIKEFCFITSCLRRDLAKLHPPENWSGNLEELFFERGKDKLGFYVMEEGRIKKLLFYHDKKKKAIVRLDKTTGSRFIMETSMLKSINIEYELNRKFPRVCIVFSTTMKVENEEEDKIKTGEFHFTTSITPVLLNRYILSKWND